MIDVENGEHQSSNTFLAHLYLSSNIPVKRLNTNLQTTSLGTLSCVQELVSTTNNDGMKQETTTIKKKTFYLPADIDERLRHSAKRNRRSLNSELVWALQQYLDHQKQEQGNGKI